MSDAAPAKPQAVKCRGLVKQYGEDVMAVNGLDLDVHAGECFGLLGPNGAGKTTTVEILEGLLEATSGDVEVLGKRWQKDDAYLREHIGLSLQMTYLPDKLTVRETIGMFRALFAEGRSIDETVKLVALEEKANARYETLSGGQRQRLAVACALVSKPKLLFLDEPTTGLDPQSRRALWDVILEFKAAGGSVVLTTHYMDEAERLCDRVGVIDHGKTIALGTPKELIDSLGGNQIVEIALAQDSKVTLAKIDLEPISALPSVHAARVQSERLALTVDQLHIALPAVLTHLDSIGAKLANLSTHHATLEDVFVKLTGRQLRE